MSTDQLHQAMGKPCMAFSLEDAAAAYEHMKPVPVQEYGSSLYGHSLHTWDAGGRFLARCSACGGYILVQESEYHSFSDAPDDDYTDFFPVSSPEEADELNRKYSGSEIETAFPSRYLMRTNGRLHWSK